MESSKLDVLKQVAAGIVAQFGAQCEVLIGEVHTKETQQTLVHIENGHLSGYQEGDTLSLPPQDKLGEHHIVWEPDGKIIRTTAQPIYSAKGKIAALVTINHDVTGLMMLQHDVNELLEVHEQEEKAQESTNITDVLEELIEQSVALVGKPVSMMNKEDKIRAIQFLDQHGAFLVTKSGGKVSKYFGISKYTLYSYIDANKEEESEE